MCVCVGASPGLWDRRPIHQPQPQRAIGRRRSEGGQTHCGVLFITPLAGDASPMVLIGTPSERGAEFSIINKAGFRGCKQRRTLRRLRPYCRPRPHWLRFHNTFPQIKNNIWTKHSCDFQKFLVNGVKYAPPPSLEVRWSRDYVKAKQRVFATLSTFLARYCQFQRSPPRVAPPDCSKNSTTRE